VVRKIVEKIPDELLWQDLERYRQRAIELGATDAKIISADMILIDERVRIKCIYPKCPNYGTNVHCPPYAMDIAQFRIIVNNFHYAIFICERIPSENLTNPSTLKKRISSSQEFQKTLAKIEAEAYYDGYHLAVGFGNGPCKRIFCPDIECSAILPGQPCRHALRARGSMSGAGMNSFTMAAKVGWDVYPIGRATIPSEAPHELRLGLVLIN